MRRITTVLGFLVIATCAACSGTSTGSGGSSGTSGNGGSGSGSGGGDSTGAGSCSDDSGGTVTTCTDYGTGFTSSSAQQACAAPKTFSASACPSANRVGVCTISASRVGQNVVDAVNFYPPAKASDVQSACEMQNGVNGVTTTFTAG